jgi:hypothetical protein
MLMAPKYFVDRDAEITLFYKLLGEGELPKPLLRVEGPSGVGKSALLHRIYEICQELKAPAALIYGDRNRSIISLLSEITEQLSPYCNPFTFREFKTVLRQIYQIQDKLLSTKKESLGKQLVRPLKLLGRGLSTAASTAAGADIILAAAAEMVGEAAMEGISLQLGETSEHLLSNEQLSLLNNSADEVLQAFYVGFARLQQSLRITVLIDGLETVQHLECWLAERFVPELNDKNTIFVVSSKVRFDPCWDALLSQSYTVQLKPFTLGEVREFLAIRSLPANRKTAKAVFELTDGLPLSVALWSEFFSSDLRSTKAKFTQDQSLAVAHQIEQHLLSQFSEVRLKNIVHVCAVLYHFDPNLLAYALDVGIEEAESLFEVLGNYTSIFRLHASGLAVHDLLRHYLVDNFRRINAAKYWEIIQLAVAYYGKKLEESPWAAKGEYAIDYVYYDSILNNEHDLLALFFNESRNGRITVTAARSSDIPHILNVDWKAFPHQENRITLERLTQWFNASPISFRVAKDELDHVLGYSCILRLAPATAQAVLDGTLSFKDINPTHLQPETDELLASDYMLDSLAIVDPTRSEVGAALLRDMLTQVHGNVRRLLSVAVTQQGASLLQRTGFELVRRLPEAINGFQYEVYLFDLHVGNCSSPLVKALRKTTRVSISS